MENKEKVREQDYKECKIRVTVRGFSTVWYWEVQVSCPEGQTDTYQASPHDKNLKNTEEAAFSAGFKRGEELIDFLKRPVME